MFIIFNTVFFVVGSLNFFKAAFLCWIAFLHSALNQGLFFLLAMEFLGIHSPTILMSVIANFSIV